MTDPFAGAERGGNADAAQLSRDREGPRPLAFPPVPLCTDNAAMIASVADRMLAEGQTADLGLEAFSRIPLDSVGEGGA